jgi:hypothetical protein
MSRIITYLLCLCLCFTAHGKKPHDENGHHGNTTTVSVEAKVTVHPFSNNDRDVIVRYYEKEHRRNPVHAKRMRHVDIVVGEPAPPSVVRVFTPLPPPLVPMLPPPPPGFRLYVAGDQIVRVDKRSNRVVECVPIPGAVPPPPPRPQELPLPPPPPRPGNLPLPPPPPRGSLPPPPPLLPLPPPPPLPR